MKWAGHICTFVVPEGRAGMDFVIGDHTNGELWVDVSKSRSPSFFAALPTRERRQSANTRTLQLRCFALCLLGFHG